MYACCVCPEGPSCSKLVIFIMVIARYGTIRANGSQSFIGQIEWEIINAMYPIGGLLGAASSGYIADKYGRKNAIHLVSMINIVASIITASSYYYALLLIGRLIMGIACGMATSITSHQSLSQGNITGTHSRYSPFVHLNYGAI